LILIVNKPNWREIKLGVYFKENVSKNS